MIASSSFILCLLFLLGEAHSLFLTACITLSQNPTVPAAQTDYMTACTLSPGSLPEHKPSCCSLAMFPYTVARCSEEELLDVWFCSWYLLPQAAERPPQWQQPALLTSISNIMLPAAVCDLGHLSPALFLFDLGNPLATPAHK